MKEVEGVTVFFNHTEDGFEASISGEIDEDMLRRDAVLREKGITRLHAWGKRKAYTMWALERLYYAVKDGDVEVDVCVRDTNDERYQRKLNAEQPPWKSKKSQSRSS